MADDHTAMDAGRRADVGARWGATEGADGLMCYEVAPGRVARRFGLGAVQRAPALKRSFMR